jgi:hypothetical protein
MVPQKLPFLATAQKIAPYSESSFVSLVLFTDEASF